MKPVETNQLIESIDHHTMSRPFGIYNVNIPKEENCALYIHCHTEAELFCLKSGKLDFVIEDTHYALNAGDCIFIPPMLIHGAYKDTDAECSFTAIVFSLELISSYYAASGYISLLGLYPQQCVYYVNHEDISNHKLLTAITNIPEIENYDMFSNELSIVGAIYIIYQELYNLCFSGISSPTNDHSIAEATDYIKMHFSENISLKDLASAAGFSEGYFGHYFTDKMGISPFSYINKVRIANASNLLATTNMPVTSVAFASGFDNISYFNRTFKKIIGVTPSAYRRSASLQ